MLPAVKWRGGIKAQIVKYDENYSLLLTGSTTLTRWSRSSVVCPVVEEWIHNKNSCHTH